VKIALLGLSRVIVTPVHFQGRFVGVGIIDGLIGMFWQNGLYEIVPRVKSRIIESFTAEALTIYEEEFRFFDKVTSISGVLFPLPKESRRAGIRR